MGSNFYAEPRIRRRQCFSIASLCVVTLGLAVSAALADTLKGNATITEPGPSSNATPGECLAACMAERNFYQYPTDKQAKAAGCLPLVQAAKATEQTALKIYLQSRQPGLSNEQSIALNNQSKAVFNQRGQQINQFLQCVATASSAPTLKGGVTQQNGAAPSPGLPRPGVPQPNAIPPSQAGPLGQRPPTGGPSYPSLQGNSSTYNAVPPSLRQGLANGTCRYDGGPNAPTHITCQPLHPPMQPGTVAVGPNEGQRCPSAAGIDQQRAQIAAGCRWINGGYDICANPDWYIYRQCVAGNRQTPTPRPLLQNTLEAINDVFNQVPGLPQALQTGSQITIAQSEALRDQWTKQSDHGVKLAIEGLLQEGVAKGIAKGIANVAGSGVVPELTRQIGDDDVVIRLTRLLNPARLAKLTTERGANPSFNKIMYWLHMSEVTGQDTGAVLRKVLSGFGVTGEAADVYVYHLQESYKLGQQLEAFTTANLTPLRDGGSAKLGPIMGNSILQVGHIIDSHSVPELGNSIVNLRWEVSAINQAAKDDLKREAVAWAQKLFNLKLISQTAWDAVQREASARVR